MMKLDYIPLGQDQKQWHAKNVTTKTIPLVDKIRENNSKEKKRLKEILKIDGDLIELNKILCEKINNDEIKKLQKLYVRK